MKKKKLWVSILLMLCLLMVLPVAVSAAKAQWKTVDGVKYYYGTNGKKYTGGPKKIKKKLYLFTSDGKLITNQVTSYKNKLYVLTKWGKVNGKQYYGTSKGYVKTGLVTYKKNYYYANPSNGQIMKKTMKKVDGKWYYFTSSGKAVKSKVYTINGAKYYFNSKGHRKTGVVKVGKYYYGFSKSNGKMQYGWKTFGDFKYYFDPKTGKAATGWKTISGKKYYFNNYGARQTGWLVSGKKKYYLDPNDNGARVSGTVKIDGKSYKFGTKGYVKYSPSSSKLKIEVNRKKCVVTIYDNGVPIKAMTCSVGREGHETPIGTFYTQRKNSWWWLDGPSTGQYCTHFLPSYLFHSVPMYGNSWMNPYKVNATDYNRLGKPASGGCIRLAVADAKWIYDNVPLGTTVKISDNVATPLGKPAVKKMTSGTTGADPTDTFKNPGGYSVKIKANDK